MKKVFYASSRAEFLNAAYHTHFKTHPQAVWTKPDGTDVWMVRMDGKVRDDFKNTRYENKVIEEYVGHDPKLLKKTAIGLERVVVLIVDSPTSPLSRYEILGTYELSLAESKIATYRVWYKISDDM